MLFKLMLLMALVGDCRSAVDIKECPTPGYTDWFIVGPYCAKHFQEEHSFGEAEEICQALHMDGHLISVHDAGSSNEVESLGPSTEMWIGGYKMPCATSWMWTDGSKWNYHNWVPGEPEGNGDCVQINWNRPGKFDDAPCCHKKSFVCAFPKHV